MQFESAAAMANKRAWMMGCPPHNKEASIRSIIGRIPLSSFLFALNTIFLLAPMGLVMTMPEVTWDGIDLIYTTDSPGPTGCVVTPMPSPDVCRPGRLSSSRQSANVEGHLAHGSGSRRLSSAAAGIRAPLYRYPPTHATAC